MLRVPLLSVGICLAIAPVFAQTLENARLCEQHVPKVTADAKLEACDALILSGIYAGHGLSEILVKRGQIYFFRKFDHARALDDFDQAISLNPRNAVAFYF